MKYYCQVCNYQAPKKYNLDVHLKTNKHLKKANALLKTGINDLHTFSTSSPKMADFISNENLKCQYCNQLFKRLDGLKKHSFRCSKVLKTVTNLKTKEKQMEKRIKELEEDVKYYRDILVDSVKSNGKPHVLIMVNNHFSNAQNIAPPLSDEMRIFGLDHPRKITYSNKNTLMNKASNILNKKNGNKEDKYFYDRMTYEYGKGRDKRNDNINREKCKNFLASYIATGIKILYKTKKPEEQAFWSTDISRYNFIIKDEKWRDDKNGQKLKEKLVTTILSDIKTRLQKQLARETQLSIDYSGENENNLTSYDYSQIIRDIPRASYIIDDIDNGSLADLIIKKTAKHFIVDKEFLNQKNINKHKKTKNKSNTKKLKKIP